MDWDIETDVVVVGGGGAGLMAAATASIVDGGVDVVLLEKDEDDPCTSVITSAFIPAAGTRFQKAAGIADAPETMAADIRKKNGGKSDPDVTLALCRRSAETIHWFVDALGVDLEFASEVTWFGHTNRRMHSHPIRSGIPIIGRMRAFIAEQRNIRYMNRAEGTGLIVRPDGVVTGVTARFQERDLRIGARKVVLTTGGYNANREMLARYIPDIQDAPNIGARSGMGDGIRWGMAANAAIAQMSGYQGRDCIFEDGTRVTPGVVNEGGIAVNSTGRRFVNEQRDYSELASIYRAQPDAHAILIWDQRIQGMAGNMHVMKEAMARGGITRCVTTDDIATRYRLPAAALAETLAEYNDGVREGRDAFGREVLTEPLEPPYYTARITGAMAHTQGGLVVDTACRVRRANGTAVPNLYAGGNTMVGLSGDWPGGYMSGNGLLVAYTSGLIIGQDTVAAIRAGE
jgi:fumarate reductase flavoprotein subunit